ncbi:MAG: phosphatidate cytidylyltransferase [Gammaproteobacteria bacterium]|nr:phosphatidate cytidylyltransferase [Gammaproteobacteria bacterium]
MLKQRILSILVLAPIFILLILITPNEWFKLLLSIVLMFAAYEWSRLAGIQRVSLSLLYALSLVSVACLADYYSVDLYLFKWIYWLSVVWWMGVLIWIALAQYHSRVHNFSNRTKMFMGLMTLLPVWYALSELHAIKGMGPQLALYLVMLVWFADIGAYVFGRWLGRVKLAPTLSPGKTVEGVMGGLFTVALLATAGTFYFGLQNDKFWMFILVSVVVAAVSVVGDLFESSLKRQAGVKDSGNLLPGHGGVLDRIDSLTAAAPLFVLGFSHFLK